jgi:hypothetical protein
MERLYLMDPIVQAFFFTTWRPRESQDPDSRVYIYREYDDVQVNFSR